MNIYIYMIECDDHRRDLLANEWRVKVASMKGW